MYQYQRIEYQIEFVGEIFVRKFFNPPSKSEILTDLVYNQAISNKNVKPPPPHFDLFKEIIKGVSKRRDSPYI